MSEWQPIETAPKDGRIFLAYSPEVGIPVNCRWDFGKRNFEIKPPIDIGASSAICTHWRDMPGPPND